MGTHQHAPWCWVHELADYKQMFDLSTQDLMLNILDCAAGPSSFNAELTQHGGVVTSCDPLYQNKAEQMESTVHGMMHNLLDAVKAKQDLFSWHTVTSPEVLQCEHEQIVRVFLDDFAQGLATGRYCGDALPKLSFEDYQFDIALCANFIFDGLVEPDTDFQINAIKEMCRVAREARIYPLLDQNGNIAQEVGPVMMALQMQDYGVEIRQVDYQFHKKGNAMLRVWPSTCELPAEG